MASVASFILSTWWSSVEFFGATYTGTSPKRHRTPQSAIQSMHVPPASAMRWMSSGSHA